MSDRPLSERVKLKHSSWCERGSISNDLPCTCDAENDRLEIAALESERDWNELVLLRFLREHGLVLQFVEFVAALERGE